MPHADTGGSGEGWYRTRRDGGGYRFLDRLQCLLPKLFHFSLDASLLLWAGGRGSGREREAVSSVVRMIKVRMRTCVRTCATNFRGVGRQGGTERQGDWDKCALAAHRRLLRLLLCQHGSCGGLLLLQLLHVQLLLGL